MSLSSTVNRADATGNGTTATYNFTFRIFSSTDLKVTVKDADGVVTTLTLTTHYTVTGGTGDSGGSISLVAGAFSWLDGSNYLESGATITIRRVRPLTQLADIRNQGSFFAETHEDEFDKLVMISQQQQDEIDRSVALPDEIASSAFDPTLPTTIADIAGRSIIVNATTNGFAMGPTADQISSAQTSATNAAASAAAAAASESAAATSASNAATSASNASSSATTAASSATSAAGSATAAASSASAAATSESNASTSETNAATSASNAATSETNASTSASNASTSASAAATSASNAATSASNAASSATAAQAAVDSVVWRDTVFVSNADSPVTIADADLGKLWVVDGSSGDVVFNLPSIAALTLSNPWSIAIKKLTATGLVTINPNGSDEIDQETALTISGANEGYVFVPDTDPTPDQWSTLAFGAVGGGSGGVKAWLTGDSADFEGSIGSWVTFDDGAVSTPVDGTGTAATNISIARTTTSGEVLAGSASLKVTKANTADAQGEGISIDFTIDYSEQGKMQQLPFKIKSGSGFVNSMFKVFVYDVTNAAIINVLTLDGGTGELYSTPSQGSSFTGVFHAAPDSVSYRAIIMCTTTATDNFSFYIDEFKPGPVSMIQAHNSTGWESVPSPTTNVTTNVTFTMRKRREGPDLLLQCDWVWTGASTDSVNVNFTIPDGLNVDTTRLAGTIRSPYMSSGSFIKSGGSPSYQLTAKYLNQTQITVFGLNASATYTTIEDANPNGSVPSTYASGDRMILEVRVPIDGWLASDVMSTHQSDFEIAKARVSRESAYTPTTGGVVFDFDTTSKDEWGMWDNTNNRMTARRTGYYTLNTSLQFEAGTAQAIQVYFRKNGSTTVAEDFHQLVAGVHTTKLNASSIYLKQGDYIEVVILTASSRSMRVGGSGSRCYFDMAYEGTRLAFGVKGVYEYEEVDITSAPITTTADTPVATTETITLSPGTWELGFNIALRLSDATGATATLGGFVHFYNTTDSAILDKSQVGRFARLHANEENFTSIQHRVRVTVTKETTYVLRVVCSASAAAGTARISAEEISVITGNELTSIMWKDRVK